MAAGFSVKDALNKNSKAGIDESPRARFRTKDISIFKMYRNDMNFYSVEQIEELAGDILMYGLKQNLELVYAPCDNYILQKDPTQQTKGKMLFGEYPIIKLSKKTLASEKIMNTDGHTIDGYKHPIFCGDLKEAVTLFDRNVLTIDLNDKGAGLWDKDMTGIKVRDRFDVQPVDKGAVIKGQITEVING